MSQTTIRVDTTERDALARVAAERHQTLGEALRRLVWEHDCKESLARLEADPQALNDYDVETAQLGDVTA